MRRSDESSRTTRRKRNNRPPKDINEEIAAKAARSYRRYWPWMILGAFLLGLYLLPNLASSRTIRGWLVDSVSEGYPVHISVDGASAGWFSPIRLTGVHVTDLEGEPLLDAEQIICRSSLSSLMFNSHAPGVVRVEKAVMLVRLTQDSSNWEQTLAQLPPRETDQPLDLDAAVEVIEGTIVLEDMVTGDKSQLTRVNGRVDYPRGDYKPLSAKLAATVADKGQLELEGEWFLPTFPTATAGDWGSGQLALILNQLPLEVASPLLRRGGLATSAAGTLSASLTASRSDQAGPLQLAIASLSAEHLRLNQPTMLAEDSVELQQASLAGTLQIEPDRLSWQGVQFEGDLGNLTTAGGVNFASLAAGNYEAAFAGYPQHLEGRVEIAALARTLPALLSVRDDVQLQSGQVAFHFDNGLIEHEGQPRAAASSPAAATKWAGSIQISGIEALGADRQVHRIPPAQISLTATNTPTGITLDSLTGQGEFFAIRGQGSLAQGQLSASISLDKLQQELQPVIDLRGIQLAGIAEVQANWARGQQSQWGATARASMTDWKLTLPQQGVWQEPNLTVNASLAGIMSQGTLQQLAQGELAINAGADLFTLKLLGALELGSDSTQWPVGFTLRGDASRWQTRLAAFMPMNGVRVEGQLNGGGQLTLGAGQFSWQDFKLHAEPLYLTTAALRIEEPLTDLSSTGSYSFADAALQMQVLRLVSSSVSVQGEQIRADFAAAKPIATGQVAFRGDWGRISHWFARPSIENQTASWRLEGTFEGSASMAAQSDLITGSLSMLNKNTSYFQLAAPTGGTQLASANTPDWKLAWTEPEATVSGKLVYRPQAGLLQLENLSVLSKMLQFAMAGTISDLGVKAVADLRGSVQYDLAKLASLLQVQLGSDFQLTGTKKSEFYVRGPVRSNLKLVSSAGSSSNSAPQPLISPELEAGLGVAWDGANLYGLPVGASAVTGKLQQSVLLIDPLDVPISQGRLQVKSKLYLYEPTPTLAIEKGRIVDNVEITPQMCRAWLKYVTPLMADVTSVQGRLSLDLNDSQIPLANTALANTSGSLAVSNALVGPGPLSQEIIFLAKGIQALARGTPLQPINSQDMVWVNVPQQQIPFTVREGRVYHQNMSSSVGNVQILTSGSVGFDQSLQMMAEIPIKSEWFQNNRGLLATLQGKKLQIPITGTVTKPQVDSRIFEQIAKQSIQGQANDLLNQGLRQGLDRLFGPPPQ